MDKRELKSRKAHIFNITLESRAHIFNITPFDISAWDRLPQNVANVMAKISHCAGADVDSKPGTLNPVELQRLSTEPKQLALVNLLKQLALVAKQGYLVNLQFFIFVLKSVHYNLVIFGPPFVQFLREDC